MSVQEPLKFIVAPHIVEDLGLNLYTDLPRVLVEFIANAHDADATEVSVSIDFDKVAKSRDALREKFKTQGSADRDQLLVANLPPDVQIVITDNGHGMDRGTIQSNFLVAGRRRREEDGKVTSPGNRVVMGRKGLGKLAGFGVAHKMEIISKKKGDKELIKIHLDYAELRKQKASKSNEIPIQDEFLASDSNIKDNGTKIILSNLVYEPLKSQTSTVLSSVGEYFRFVRQNDFKILINGRPPVPTPRNFLYEYPVVEKQKLNTDQLIVASLTTEDGDAFSFKYRIRFNDVSLPAKSRGVRVYAHQRLASAPSLLDLPTAIHGFKQTHYMDAIVEADFIDENKLVDYISTDRQTLRWETPRLAKLREFLVQEMEKACRVYQGIRDEEARKKVEEDTYTQSLFQKFKLPAYKKRIAAKMCSRLLSHSENDPSDQDYQRDAEILINGLGKGEMLAAFEKLASSARPNTTQLLVDLENLSQHELEDVSRIFEAKVLAITSLKKIVTDRDFKQSPNEMELFGILKKSPWLINPQFNSVFAANRSNHQTYIDLLKHLEIEEFLDKKYDKTAKSETEKYGNNKRPDLVFLLMSESVRRIVITELKAPNVPMHIDHLQQLKDYMRSTEGFFKKKSQLGEWKVDGLLIGSMPENSDMHEKAERLRYDMKEMDKSNWRVVELVELVNSNEAIHRDLLDIATEKLFMGAAGKLIEP